MFKSIVSEYPVHQALPFLLPTVLQFLWALSVLKTECTLFHQTSSSAHLSVGSHPSAHSFCLTNIEFTQLSIDPRLCTRAWGLSRASHQPAAVPGGLCWVSCSWGIALPSLSFLRNPDISLQAKKYLGRGFYFPFFSVEEI